MKRAGGEEKGCEQFARINYGIHRRRVHEGEENRCNKLGLPKGKQRILKNTNRSISNNAVNLLNVF